MSNLTDLQQAVTDGYTAIAAIRLGQRTDAYVWAVLAVRAAARVLAPDYGGIASVGLYDTRKAGNQ
jgi:hypothetical protein